MKRLNVLVACEESQAVCKEFRRLGHRAFSCDLQECSGGHPEWHICGDVLSLINGNCFFTTSDFHTHTQDGEWDLLIAHPPCTFLTNAGACRMFKVMDGKHYIELERYKKMRDAKAFFLNFYHAECSRIAIENPVALKLCELPQYTQIIQPYEYGHPYTKKTCLWLKGLPKLVPTNVVEPIGMYVNGNSNIWKREAAAGKVIGGEKSAKHRSKTFPGIAQAMAEQWSKYILECEE